MHDDSNVTDESDISEPQPKQRSFMYEFVAFASSLLIGYAVALGIIYCLLIFFGV